MYYDEYGNREHKTIVFLHGAAATDTFSNQYCFQEQFHLVVPHLYGSGREVDKIYEPEQTIKDLAELIKGLSKGKVILIGHSLGGELAVALASRYEELFEKAIFLSAWVCATQKTIDTFAKLSKYTGFTLKYSWLIRFQARYWHYTKEQEEFMVSYTKKITTEQYTAWFTDRILLDENPEYAKISIPMLAICGKKEVKEMIHSIEELGKRNSNCKTIYLDKAKHDFPLRMSETLNPILLEFII